MSKKPINEKINKKESSGSRSVRRAIGILEYILECDHSVSISEIVNSLKIPKSTAYELVNTLTDTGVLSPVDNAKVFFWDTSFSSWVWPIKVI
jgi:predicted transcriptional regulator